MIDFMPSAGTASGAAWALCILSFAGLVAFAVAGRWRTPYERAEVLGAQNRIIGLAICCLGWAALEWATRRGASMAEWPAAVVLRELFDWGRYVASAVLLLHLLSPQEPLKRWARARLPAAVGGTVMALGLAAAMEQALWPAQASAWNWLPQLMMAVLLLTLLEQTIRNASSQQRWSMVPLALGLGLMFGFDLYRCAEAFLMGVAGPGGDLLRVMAHAIAAPLVALSVRRQVGAAARMRVSRTVVFYTGTMTLAGAYMLAMAAAGTWVRYFGGDWGPALQTLMLSVGILIVVTLLVSPALRARVRVVVTKHFFAYRYEYREEWLRFTALLSTQGTPGEVGVRVVQGLAAMVEAPSGSLWLRDKGVGEVAVYSRLAHWPPGEHATEAAASIESEHPMIAFLAHSGWVIDLQEWRDRPEHYDQLDLPPVLEQIRGLRLVIPLTLGHGTLEGFVLLHEPRAVLDLDWEVRDLLKTAARQAASYLAYMTATSELLESRKFEAFNRMSAFVVHDLKNIVTQLSLMMRNAQRLQDNPAFRADMLMTVDSAVEKMRRLMAQLREGAADDAHRPVDVGSLLLKLQTRAAQRGRRVEIRAVPRVCTRGSKERLERVLGHLLDNALDATPPAGRVWLHMEPEPSQVCVEVGDTGQGMSEDFMKNRLFRAFSSTKAEGMGIGLHESLQYVRELGGRIEPQSSPGQGTVMRVWLPLLHADLHAPLPLDQAA